jgi:hypothetical protein
MALHRTKTAQQRRQLILAGPVREFVDGFKQMKI